MCAILLFYTYAFGLVFPAIFFLLSIHLLVAQKFKIEAIFFLMIVLFFAVSPIEEVNSFYGLLLGFLYQALFKGNNEIEFNAEEQVWVDRVATTKTFEDVLQLSRELYEWAKSQDKANEEQQPIQADIDWDNPAAGNELEQEYQPENTEEGEGEGEDKTPSNQKSIEHYFDP